MTAGARQSKPVRRERRIIERPRLIKMLDECDARVILLLAPAGYGKTTLARQWAKSLNGSIWVTLTPAHRDVVTFAEDIGLGLGRLGDGESTTFIRKYVRARSNPQRAARDIGIALSERIRIARTQWLVLDDYHEINAARDVDDMVRVVVEHTNARLLIATRTRPSWATSRRKLYGEILEMDQLQLAMNESESARLVGNSSERERLLSQARGWPALLGLAAGMGDAPMQEELSTSLYEYLAEEVFQSVSPSLQDQLLALSLLPDLSQAQLSRRFGSQSAAVVAQGRDCGLLTGEGAPELHPLVRDFLLAKLQRSPEGRHLARDAVASCLRCERWDGAVELIERFGLQEMARPALEQAYSPLVRSGRIGSVSRFAAQLRSDLPETPPVVDLTDAEVALRDGEYRLAAEIIRRARPRFPELHPLRSRAAAVEGAATFQLAQFVESENAFEAARQEATDGNDRAEALHGLALAAIFGEQPSANARLEALGKLAHSTSAPLDVARYAAAALTRMRIGSGFIDSPFVEDALRALPKVEDPRARTSVMLTITYCLALQCEFARAKELAQQMLAEVDAYQLEFARPHAAWNLAFVELGMRRFSAADRHLRAVEDAVHANPHPHHLLNARVLRSRLLMELARLEDAYKAVRTSVEGAATPAMHGEYIATRALVLSLLGLDQEAVEMAAVATRISISSEVQVLADGVSSIVAARNGDDVGASKLMETARTNRTWEPVVCCLRASPKLFASLAGQDDLRPQLEWLFARSNDRALARRAGFRTRTNRGPAEILSPREQEVLGLMAQGYRNREIAAAFVISESTVKVHARHIYEKLGVRTRTQAVAQFRSLS
jgi:ATP/maltotriose-dependent transcriptional regulator MalT